MTYHPDRYTGDKVKAHEKTIEINEAYAILSDENKRKSYDNERSARKNEYEPEVEEDEPISSKHKNDVLEADWKIAIEHVNGLDELHSNLYRLSPDVAFTFKLEVLESKDFLNSREIALKFSYNFLKKYFGNNPDIQEFAQWLLVNGHKEIAKELNKVITVLGSDFTAKSIIDKLSKKHNIEYRKSHSSNEDGLYKDKLGLDKYIDFVLIIILIPLGVAFVLSVMSRT